MQPSTDHIRRERDACGIGFLADASGRASRTIVEGLLEGLARMRHRGAGGADRLTGGGAGLLLPLPRALIPGPWCGLAMVFLRDEAARAAIEEACVAEGLGLGGWRSVPTVPAVLGEQARASMPRIEQLVLLQPLGVSLDEAEGCAYRARRRVQQEPGAYVASLSFRTVTYKALCAADQLEAFYPDLRDPALAVPFGIFHQRFSTNTAPSWERAQPLRLLCHNGEINSIDGNVAWMRARGYVLEEDGSDSTLLDNALELLVRGGRDIRHSAAMLIPEAVDADPELDQRVRSFYRYHSTLLEPWDGPAGVVFTDGRVVGATLDRNGLRPLRYAVADDRLVACASEAGALSLPAGAQIRRGRLGPGQMLVVDPAVGIEESPAVKQRLARKRPYTRWLRATMQPFEAGVPVSPPTESLTARQAAAGYTREDLSLLLRPSAATGSADFTSAARAAASRSRSRNALYLPGSASRKSNIATAPTVNSSRPAYTAYSPSDPPPHNPSATNMNPGGSVHSLSTRLARGPAADTARFSRAMGYVTSRLLAAMTAMVVFGALLMLTMIFFPRGVVPTLEQTGLDGSALEIEITGTLEKVLNTG